MFHQTINDELKTGHNCLELNYFYEANEFVQSYRHFK